MKIVCDVWPEIVILYADPEIIGVILIDVLHPNAIFIKNLLDIP